jgi:aminopeptidase YwaD
VIACGSTAPRPSVPEAPTRIGDYARDVHAAFDPDRAQASVVFVDRFFRVRGNEGYQASLAHVRRELEEGSLEVRALELGPIAPTWTPRSASLALNDGPVIEFTDETGAHRASLLVGSDSLPETELELVRAGDPNVRDKIVLADGEVRPAFELFVRQSGAAGIVVRTLEPYHRDPDAAQFGYLPAHEGRAFGFSVSQNMWQRLSAATAHGPARVRVAIDVAVGQSAASAIEARIPGTDPRAGAIVFVAHVDEPGANDNASGVAALAELARALKRITDRSPVRRTLVFLWGQEIEVSQRWLADPPLPVGAGLVMDMVGADPAIVGAPFLIERTPDPGAIWLRDPDAHSEWGASEVTEAQLRGHFLNDLTIAALESVSGFDGPFDHRAHPFEGGSDHVPFLDRGLPALLAWHFTDGAYHTTLDRAHRVSGAQMRRVAAVLGATALSMASGDARDANETIAIVERAIDEQLASLAQASSTLITTGASDEATEAYVRRAWIAHYDQALESIAAWHPGVEVRDARARLAALR